MHSHGMAPLCALGRGQIEPYRDRGMPVPLLYPAFTIPLQFPNPTGLLTRNSGSSLRAPWTFAFPLTFSSPSNGFLRF
jgi:hypothetical protein